MSRNAYLEDREDMDERNTLPAIRNMSKRDRPRCPAPSKKRQSTKPNQAEIIASLAGQGDDQKVKIITPFK